MINDIIRKSIIDQKKQILLSEDRELRKLFLDIYVSLPHNMSLWHYNSNSLKSIRPKLDKLTDQYIQTYHAEEYAKLLGLLAEQSSAYNTAYGNPDSGDRYLEGKLQDLHTRMGNTILREMVSGNPRLITGRPPDQNQKILQMASGRCPARDIDRLFWMLFLTKIIVPFRNSTRLTGLLGNPARRLGKRF